MPQRLAQLLLSSEIGGFIENLPNISGFPIGEAVPGAWFVNQDLQNYEEFAYHLQNQISRSLEVVRHPNFSLSEDHNCEFYWKLNSEL